MGYPDQAIEKVERLEAEIKRLREALSPCEAWIERWTGHVGNCQGGNECTCGRTAILYEANAALDDDEQLPNSK